MKNVILKVAGNITYCGFTYNTRLQIEYKHTGPIYYKSKSKIHFTSNREIYEDWKKSGTRAIEETGHYYIERIAILNSDGSIWYINNPGDNYRVNKCSKFWNRMHQKLSKQN